MCLKNNASSGGTWFRNLYIAVSTDGRRRFQISYSSQCSQDLQKPSNCAPKTTILSMRTINYTNYNKSSFRRVGSRRSRVSDQARQKLYTTTFFNSVQEGISARSPLSNFNENHFLLYKHSLDRMGQLPIRKPTAECFPKFRLQTEMNF